MNNYTQALEYLYARLPMFTRDGAAAINKGLDRTIQFCEYLGNPQRKFKTIHVAGTNGKGSSSHMITSILEAAGLKTGLYTSPHLVDFRERIRVHGAPVSPTYVLQFVQKHQAFIEQIKPSFFEVTVAMAFDYFAQQNVDVAIIEVGLGGRLDSTNVIHPIVSLITNIGLDHMDMLGDTLSLIAAEKAGIIKESVPVVISEWHHETAAVFRQQAEAKQAPIIFASEIWEVKSAPIDVVGYQVLDVTNLCKAADPMQIQLDLLGSYQTNNLKGVLQVVQTLRTLGFRIADEHIYSGLRQVQQRTGLMGRWQTISTEPYVICDTGHNEDGVRQVVQNLAHTSYRQLHFVLGAMKDKDLSHILPLLPQDALYHFCAPDMPRAMLAQELQNLAGQYDLQGTHYQTVVDAYQAALAAWQQGDLIFVGGSTFVVAEVLTSIQTKE